jgi:ElaB/YqjD/DUF883 family membrane-anchored ribosome-binding protein
MENSMTETTEGTGEDTTAHLAAIRQDIAQLSESIKGLLQGPAPGVAQQVSDAVDDAKAKLSSTAADVKSRVSAVGGEIEASIERNPLTAVIISFGVGVALGIMSRLRH